MPLWSLLSPDEGWDGSVDGSGAMIDHANHVDFEQAEGSEAAGNIEPANIGDAIGADRRGDIAAAIGNETLARKGEAGKPPSRDQDRHAAAFCTTVETAGTAP